MRKLQFGHLLPKIRQNLQLKDGGVNEHQQRSWLLYDPVQHLYFSINSDAFEMLRYWEPGINAAEFADKYREKIHGINNEDVISFILFLRSNHLTVVEKPMESFILTGKAKALSGSFAKKLLHNYLFFRIPLFRPDAFLEQTLAVVKPLFSASFRNIVLITGLIGIVLAIRQWEAFVGTFNYFLNLEGFFYSLLMTIFVKTCHELGHAYTAKMMGCRVPSMGVAFIVLYPMLYSDMTDTWKLQSSQDRLRGAMAGMKTELTIALLATFFWSFLPDGAIRTAMFFLAAVSWIGSLAINISPFMRFDGYYIVSDLLKMPNLHERSFAFGRWQLRRLILGIKQSPPEEFPAGKLRFLILFAWATWIYRLLVFLGIALLVYHFAFKILGIFLFMVEIVWFIIRPITNEMRQWWKMRREITFNPQLILRGLLWLAPFLILIIPWKGTLTLPAVLKARYDHMIFAPENGKIIKIHARTGESVGKDRILIELASDTLKNEKEIIRLNISMLKSRIDRHAAWKEDLASLQVMYRELGQYKEYLKGIDERQEKLVLKSHASGEIVWMNDIAVGQWVSPREPLLEVAHNEAVVIAYIEETDLTYIKNVLGGYFVFAGGEMPDIAVKLVDVDKAAVENLEDGILASISGGDIAVMKYEGKLRPQKAVYRVSMEPAEKIKRPIMEFHGYVTIKTVSHSIIERFYRKAVGVIIRESGL